MINFTKQKNGSRYKTYVEDKMLDHIFESKEILEIDTKNEIMALKLFLKDLKVEEEKAKAEYEKDTDNDLLYNEYIEVLDKCDALEDTIDYLEDLLDRLLGGE